MLFSLPFHHTGIIPATPTGEAIATLTQALKDAEAEHHKPENQKSNWPEFYARFIVDQIGTSLTKNHGFVNPGQDHSKPTASDLDKSEIEEFNRRTLIAPARYWTAQQDIRIREHLERIRLQQQQGCSVTTYPWNDGSI